MFQKLIKRVIGDPNAKILDGLQHTVQEVNALEDRFVAMTDQQLRETTNELRDRAQSGESLDDLLYESAALVREASKRTAGMRHYDVQIMGGTLIHESNVIEMRTGEGKTLVGTIPLFLNALNGRGVHLVTVNDYLVKRDGGWMGKIFHFLGMSVGCIGSQQFSGIYDPEYVNPGAELEDERLVHWRPCTRKEAYLADITYGTSSEFGFDYLRDNMVSDPERLVQRGLVCAVIDEVDNVLIDESRTPLIISGPAERSGKDYSRFSGYVRNLKENTVEDEEAEPNGHYDIDHKSRSISLTEMGTAEIERRIDEIDSSAGDSLYDPRFFHLTYYLDNALKAQYLFHRDQQYMVSEGQVVIIDDFTGRPMPSRRYSDGLHEAIEAKENVEIKRETTTVATITLQNYFRMYEKLAGMTGTAMTDAEEFDKIYQIGVFPLPTNVQNIVDTNAMGLRERHGEDNGTKTTYYVRPDSEEKVFFKRTDHGDQVYGTGEARDLAVIDEIKRVSGSGRPVLVGTGSVEHSDLISRLLKKEGVKHQVLNAKMHQSEALVVAQAGRKGAVTISTNMAGRGTDILLGGNAEGLAAGVLEEEFFDRKLLNQLAVNLLTKGETDALEMANKMSKLDPELVPALQEVKAEFDAASEEIEGSDIQTYLAQKFYREEGIDVPVLRQMLSQVRLGALNGAREYLEEQDLDTALVDEAVRLNDLHTRYQLASRDDVKAGEFLAEQLFDQHYTARAALVRAVMADDIETARAVVDQIPGMDDGMVDRVMRIKSDTELERKEVWELGGLHVVATERHESRRIDNQLRGRAARQGDPGSARFFISLEDDLMLRFGGERLRSFYDRFDVPEDLPIENGMISRLIENSQTRLEGYNFDIRKNLVEYDDVMAKQRETIYSERREILLSEEANLDAKVEDAFTGVIDNLAANYIDDYQSFVRAEVDRVVGDATTDATDDVNLRPVLIRLRSMVSQLRTVDRAELEVLNSQQLTARLMEYAAENEDNGRNIYQLLQGLRSFVPLLPRVPNVAQIVMNSRNKTAGKEEERRRFMKRVEELYDDFLAEQMSSGKEAVWGKAQREIGDAFVRFDEKGSVDQLKAQQDRFKKRVDDALSDLLLDSLKQLDGDQLVSALDQYVKKQAGDWRERIGEEEYRGFQRTVLLHAIDREWRDYLTAMDDLRREIQLESFAQRDPKVMYKKRSFEMFQDMRNNINEYVAKTYFQMIDQHHAFVVEKERAAQQAVQASNAAGASGSNGVARKKAPSKNYQVVQREHGKGQEVRRTTTKIGRNDPCWCGSGKKYKKCHMNSDKAAVG